MTCLKDLLTGGDQIVAANALLKQLLEEVRVWDDPEARDGLRVELHGELAQMLNAQGQAQESAR